jgi:hypothetical protein
MITHTSSLSSIAMCVLDDVRHYLSVIEPAAYQSPMELLSGSSIGQHTRHIIEFYNCLLEQSAGQDDIIIDYSKRRRDYSIETEPDHALQFVNHICDQLIDFEPGIPCQLDGSEHGQEGMLVDSTLGRELIYNIEHTIHHLAIVKIALRQSMPDLALPGHFGVAPSTIRHRQEACAQ